MQKRVVTEYGIIDFDYKHTKGNRISAKILNNGEVRVTSPKGVSFAQVESFVNSRAKWIISTSKEYQAKYQLIHNSELEEIFILGKAYSIKYVESDIVKIIFEDDIFYLYGEKERALIQFRKYIFDFAKSYFNDRFNTLKGSFPKAINTRLTFSNVKSWWGSYNIPKDIVKLAYRLIARPNECIDAVIYHELNHIDIHNHQKSFYAELLAIYPDYFKWKKMLRNSVYNLTDNFIYAR